MSIPEVVLANVLADALAHHEASSARSLVRESDPDGNDRWLDFQRAGEVAAAALVYAGQVDGDGRLLFAVRVNPTTRTVAPADGPSAGAAPSDAEWQELADKVVAQVAIDEPAEVLVSHVLSLARRVMPKDAQRHNSLLAWMRELGVQNPMLHDLHNLSPAQLLRLLEKLRYYGGITGRLDPGPQP